MGTEEFFGGFLEVGRLLEIVIPFVKDKRERAREAAHFVLIVLAESYEYVRTNKKQKCTEDMAIRWSEAIMKIKPYSKPAADLCEKMYDRFLKGGVSESDLPDRIDFKLDGKPFHLMLAESRVIFIDQDGTEKLLFSKDHLLADAHVSKGHPTHKLMVKQIEGRSFKTDATQSVVVPITGDARPKVVDMDVIQVVQPKPSSVVDSVKGNLRHKMNDSRIDLK